MNKMEKKNRRGISQGAWRKGNLPLPDGMTKLLLMFVNLDLCMICDLPTCPNCGKTFTKDMSVTCHLSQPRTSCHSSIQDIVNILQFAEIELPSHHTSLQADPGVLTTDMCNSDNQAHANFDGNFNFIEDGFGVAEGSLEERYKGARMCYSKDGLTFLDLFDTDDFAECRKKNLFYPFTSKEEWEIGNFLLHSPLSMAVIDVFLKLPLRCFLVDRAGSVKSSPPSIPPNI
ncbi:hypothetical protein EDB19DRAFT_1830535 [Suillus lakei]|nr:hypothetical protein EDB19DRAFT_1830535 [Suillus lakei]